MALPYHMLARIVPVAVIGALGAFAYVRSRMLPRFPYRARPLSDADYAAMAKPGWRAHQFGVAPGVELRCLLREPAAADSPWVLFFNGNSPHMLSEGQQVLHALCAKQGWGGVVWAYRGFDSSSGVPTPDALEDDGFKAYMQLLSERRIRPDAVHLVGFSLGTSIAAAVAGRAHRNPPASLTLLAPMTRLYMGERTQLLLHRYETSKWLEKIASPTLVIHGKCDDTLGVENGRAVAAALGSRATLRELPELGHDELPMSAAVQDAVRTFISQHSDGETRWLTAP